MSNTFYIYKFLNQLKYRTIKYPLNHSNLRKYSFYINFVTKYLMRQMTYLLSIGIILFNIWLIIVGYLNGSGNYNIIYLMIHFIIAIFAVIHYLSILSIGFIVWFGSAFYLKMKFNENNNRIIKSLQSLDSQSVASVILLVIKEHSYIRYWTRQIDHTLRCVTYILYCLSTIGMQFGLNVMIIQKVAAILKLFIGLYLLIVLLQNFSMNMMSTWVISAAHKPYKFLNSFMARKNSRISLRNKIKINLSFRYFLGTFYQFDQQLTKCMISRKII